MQFSAVQCSEDAAAEDFLYWFPAQGTKEEGTQSLNPAPPLGTPDNLAPLLGTFCCCLETPFHSVGASAEKKDKVLTSGARLPQDLN